MRFFDENGFIRPEAKSAIKTPYHDFPRQKIEKKAIVHKQKFNFPMEFHNNVEWVG